MNITEQAAKVLAEIDEQLALADKATAGPWRAIAGDSYCAYPTVIKDKGPHFILFDVNDVEKETAEADTRFPGMDIDAAFIASARTVCPTALRMLKTAIERRLKCYLSNRRFLEDTALTSWQDLNELINQWNSK